MKAISPFLLVLLLCISCSGAAPPTQPTATHSAATVTKPTAAQAQPQPTNAAAQPTATHTAPTATQPAPTATKPAAAQAQPDAANDPEQDAPACTSYANSSATGPGDGSLKQPWQRLADALANSKPGTTLCLEGTFAERIIPAISGTSGNEITIRSRFASSRATLNLQGLDVPEGDQGAVHIVNQSFLRIKNLDITAYTSASLTSSPTGILVRSEGDAQLTGISLIGNHIYKLGNTHGTTFSADELASCATRPVAECINDDLKWNISAFGIAIKGRSTKPITKLLIHGNELDQLQTGASESLVVNGNVDGWVVSHNLIHNNNNIGIDAIGYEDEDSFPAGFDPELNRARNGTILGNRVWDISSDGNPSYAQYSDNGSVSSYDRSADGIYVDGGSHNLIEGNLVINTNIGIELAAEANLRTTDYNIVRNNIIANVDYAALLLGGYSESPGEPGGHDGGGASTNNAVVNNTVYTLTPDSLACAEQFRVSDNLIANNICAALGDYQLQIDMSDNTAATNLVIILSPTQPNPDGLFVSVDLPTASELRSWSSVEVQRFLHTTASPKIHDAGTTKIASQDIPFGTQDIDGQPRLVGASVDIGANEIQTVK